MEARNIQLYSSLGVLAVSVPADATQSVIPALRIAEAGDSDIQTWKVHVPLLRCAGVAIIFGLSEVSKQVEKLRTAATVEVR
jgi:hypothetical protein